MPEIPNIRISVADAPRAYTFEINGYAFRCEVEHADHTGMHPMDILQLELSAILKSLLTAPRFTVSNTDFKKGPYLIAAPQNENEPAAD